MRTAALVAIFCLAASAAHAVTLDRTVTIQGTLLTGSGVPANGQFDLDLRLYAAETGGSPLWSGAAPGVVVEGGVFDATVGPLPAAVVEQTPSLWLEVVADGTPLPRRPMRATPFALVAQTAHGALDLACTGCVGAAELEDGAVGPAKLAAGTYAINVSGNAATATSAVTAGSAAALTGPLAGDVTGTQGATTVERLNGVPVAPTAPSDGQALKYDAAAGRWEPAADAAGTGTVTKVSAGAGLKGGPITTSGKLSVRLSGSGGLSAGLGPGSNELGIAAAGVVPGMVAGGTYGIDVSGHAATATSADVAAALSGPLAGDVTGTQGATSVKKVRGVPVAATTPTNGQVLTFDAAAGKWKPQALPPGTGGTVTSVTAGTGLTGGTITTSGTIGLRLLSGGGLSATLGAGDELGIPSGGVAPGMLQAGTYGISIAGNAATAGTATTAQSAASFTGPLAGDVTGGQGATVVERLRGVPVKAGTPSNGQVLKYSAANGRWQPASDANGGGTVKSVGTGAGLTGGTITSTGTVGLNLASAGGLASSLGTGSQLGVKPGGIVPGMVAAGTYGISISGSAASAAKAASFTGSLAGDVTGTQGSTTVARIRGRNVASTAPSNGYVLKYSASNARWEPAPDSVGGGVTSVKASSPLASSGGSSPTISLGIVPTSKGGTGITSAPTTSGQFLRSSGSGTWAVAKLSAGDLPSGSNSYIQNRSSGTQSANFRISGSGTLGSLTFGGGSVLGSDQGGSIELGHPVSSSKVPFIDFHYGVGSSQDYNVRVQNSANRKLLITSPGTTTLEVTGDVYANRMIDRSSSSYYVDPASTTKLNGLYVGGKALSTYIRDYVNANCYVYFGWRDSCSGCSSTPTKYGRTRGASSGCKTYGSDGDCATFNLGSKLGSPHTSIPMYGMNTDGDVDGNDKFWIGIKCY